MMFFTIILVLFILLILISIANTLIFIALKLVTREHYKENYLIIPSLLTLLIWCMAYIVLVKVISTTVKITLIEAMSALLFNTSEFTKYVPDLLFPIIIILIVTLFLQSAALLTVNTDYRMIFNKSRYFVKQKSKPLIRRIRRNNDIISRDTKTELQQVIPPYRLTFSNAFVCCLFIFSLLFFLNILFFWIGTMIGNKII